MKMGDAGSRPPVVFADACRTTPSLPLPELRHAHVPRASTVLISYGPVWPQLTHCSASINIAAALSCLLTSVATVTAKFLLSKSKSEFNIKSEVERNNIKFEVQVSSSSTGKEV